MKTLKSRRGLTLIELLISIVIISLVAGVCVRMVGGALDSWEYSRGKSELLSEARNAIERMVSRVRSTTWVLLPLMISDPSTAAYYPRDILAVSGNVDNDGDGLADEDPGDDITGDGLSGIMLIDDDGDLAVDEGSVSDDDEEDAAGQNEDKIDGIDNDGDGRVDEDPANLFYTYSGDDDNDGAVSEDPFDPVIYYLNGTTLMERQNVLAETIADNIIAENVAQFEVLRRRVNGNTLIDIYLKLDNGKDSVEIATTALARRMFKP